MTFNIQFIDGNKGQISLGDTIETFIAVFDYWSAKEYEGQWKEAANTILGQEGVEAFFTNIHSPEVANYYSGWIALKTDDQVMFTEMLFLKDNHDLAELLNPAIRQQILSEELNSIKSNDSISKWFVPLSSLKEYASKVNI